MFVRKILKQMHCRDRRQYLFPANTDMTRLPKAIHWNTLFSLILLAFDSAIRKREGTCISPLPSLLICGQLSLNRGDEKADCPMGACNYMSRISRNSAMSPDVHQPQNCRYAVGLLLIFLRLYFLVQSTTAQLCPSPPRRKCLFLIRLLEPGKSDLAVIPGLVRVHDDSAMMV